jgi:putative membrane protein
MTPVSTLARSLCLFSIATTLAAGCASTPKTAEAEPGGRLTDAQIAAIVVAANQIDIENGELADSKSQNPDVKAFANRMIEDHRSVNQAASDLVTKLGVTPEENATSRSLKDSAKATREQMQALSGAQFDKAYVDNEVAYHKAVIAVLDSTLIPSATNEELKAMLVGVRPAFVAHLEHAQKIQASLAGGAQSSVDHSSH